MLKKDFLLKEKGQWKIRPGTLQNNKSAGKGYYSLELASDSSQQVKKVNRAHLKPYLAPTSSHNQSALVTYSY